jgi:hypothetical protein
MTSMTSRESRAPPSRQHDLFAEPRLPGLSLFEDRVQHAEEQALIAAIDGVELSPFRFQGWLGKRLTAAYGWSYDFDTGRFAPAEAIPDWLLPLRQTAARLTGLPVDDLVQALLIRYDPGAGIGWHRDRPVFGHNRRGVARRAGDHALPPSPAGRVRSHRCRPPAAVDLPHDRRGAARLGAQHRAHGRDAPVGDISHACPSTCHFAGGLRTTRRQIGPHRQCRSSTLGRRTLIEVPTRWGKESAWSLDLGDVDQVGRLNRDRTAEQNLGRRPGLLAGRPARP